MALLWSFRPRTRIFAAMTALGMRRDALRAFTPDDVKQALADLRRDGVVLEMSRREGYFRLRDDLRGRLYREVLDTYPLATLRDAVRGAGQAGWSPRYPWAVHDGMELVALVRLELLAGDAGEDLDRIQQAFQQGDGWSELMRDAMLPGFDPALFERIALRWRARFAVAAIAQSCVQWRTDTLPVVEWALAKLESDPSDLAPPVRLVLAELLMHRGDHARMTSALDGVDVGLADALRACALVQTGRWSDAQRAFEAAIKRAQTEAGARKRVLPASIAWLYPLCLLAQQTPAHLELARKFCLGEAGSRTPDPYHGWGRWAHAIGVRLGDVALDRHVFSLRTSVGQADIDALWGLLLAAWIGRDALRAGPGGRADALPVAACAKNLRQALAPIGFVWLQEQVAAAETVLGGLDPPAGFFVPPQRERWRDVLASLQALGTSEAKSEAHGDASRIVWTIAIDARGGVASIEPLEQKRGTRGWGKPKPIPLSRIAGSERLSPWDAKVARAIRVERMRSHRHAIDLAAAIMSLVGHPAVALSDAPEQLIDVVEGSPEVEVVREADRFVVRVTPEVRADGVDDDADEDDWQDPSDDRRSAELRAITLVRESPQRLRVVRLTAAQRRAAQLVAGRLVVPASAQDELQHALRSLAAHFEVHADHAQAAREVASQSRLRAELSPVGDQLRLRLVVAPLGADGPRVAPGSGRARLMAAVGGETVGTRRDLAAERAQLDAVLDALPFLDDAEVAGSEWLIADPESALIAVEALPKLAAVEAVEWPKGKPVRVHTVDVKHLAVVVRRERDWFRLHGRATVDEGVVLDFQTLIAAAQARSRFVPMGEGAYAALTESLKSALSDLAAVAETDRDGARVPSLAAAWLGDVLHDAQVQSDDEFRAAIARLHRAQDEPHAVPKALQAELRPYQEDGYRWAMRLASAGFGGCLADDMGLGKTLQGLAVLLARAAGGAALVVAPTSVCGNWLAEARRFAPTLRVVLYGEGDREAVVTGAGPADVIVLSYTLLQQAQERFAARRWHTVLADEAQAIKNAAAKRSLAVFDLEADFRLALSGTPIENRLSELWSIMRFSNPGLLGTQARFTERFATPIERDRDREAQHRVKRLIAPFVLRRTKAQVLQELPARTELDLALTPSPSEAAHYEALRRQAVASVDRALATEPAGQARLNVLAQLTRLRRAACDPRLTTPQIDIVGTKVQAFADLAADLVANGHKALVFSQFVDFLSLLRKPLDAAGIAYQYLDGSTPAAERTRRIDAFQAGHGDLFLVSLKAGGYGLNLTAADYVLITDPWWNPAAEDQAMGRAHRMGQTRPVTVYRLVTKGTIEERIVALHTEKRALAESVLADGDAATLPSADDLVALMRG